MAASDVDDTLLPRGAGRPSQDQFAVGSLVQDRYRIERFIAAGGMGEVYAAHDLVLDTTVALKTLRPELEGSAEAIARLRREIALARSVTNPHICRLHDVGEHRGRVFLSMELLEGRTLAELVGRHPLAVDEVERLARQLVAGLSALHRASIIHRDFKTSNVIVVGAGDAARAVITDFGLARSIDATDARITLEPGLFGTPAYMAPEQVEARPATTASDIYSLGIVLFELLTGRLPFDEDTAMATATARLTKDPPRPSALRADIPPRWDGIVLRCLARDPSARFARVDDVLVGGRRRRRWSTPLVLGAASAGLAVVLVAWLPTSPATSTGICATAATKLDGVWDAGTRAALARRYETATRPFVRAMWKAHERQLVPLFAAWSERWDAACASPERTADPLLYGQRLACLESSLGELRAYVGGLSDPQLAVEDVARASPGEYPIDPPANCDDVVLLRAQPAPAPAASRAAIDLLRAEGNSLRAKLRLPHIGGLDIDRDAVFARMTVIEDRLVKLGDSAGAGDLRDFHVMFLAEAGRTDDALALAQTLVELAEETRDDALLVRGLMRLLHARAYRTAGYAIAGGEALLDRAKRVARRIGAPATLRNDIAEAERGHAIRAGQPERVRRVMQEQIAAATELGWPYMASWTRADLASFDDDVAAAQAILEANLAHLGPDNVNLAYDYLALAPTFARAGDVERAYALARDAVRLIEGSLGAQVSSNLASGLVTAARFAHTLGRTDAAEAHLRAAVAALVVRGDRDASAYADLVERALAVADVRFARHVLARARDVAATADDRARLAAAETRLLVETGAIRDPARIPGVLDRDPLVRARVLVAAGSYAEANALATPLADGAQSDERQRAAAIAGIALVELGKAAEAVTMLERAFPSRTIVSYDARFALARALRASGGDAGRAMKLARDARRGFAATSRDLRAIDAWLDGAR